MPETVEQYRPLARQIILNIKPIEPLVLIPCLKCGSAVRATELAAHMKECEAGGKYGE